MKHLISTIIFTLSPVLAHSYDLQVVRVHDGDTIIMHEPALPPPLDIVSIRIRGIDTPELHGKCAKERKKANEARVFLANTIPIASRIELQNFKWDKYGGRIDALERKGKVWMPKYGQRYYYKAAYCIANADFDGGHFDKSVIVMQRVYSTREEAEANDCRKETIAIWNKFREMETEAVDWSNVHQSKYRIYYDHYDNGFFMAHNHPAQHLPDNEWYTTSEQAAQWVIKNMQAELKKIWRV